MPPDLLSYIGWPQAIVLLVALERLWIKRRARIFARRLREEGGVEHAAWIPSAVTILHAAWIIALLIYTPPGTPVNIWWVAVFVAAIGLRYWCLVTLGRYWTINIISMPDAPLVQDGPYRFLRHPIYYATLGEFFALAAAFGMWWIAIAFTLADAILMAVRIHAEATVHAGKRKSY